MTAAAVIAALEAARVVLLVTDADRVSCSKSPPPNLLSELRVRKVEVLALLRDPDRHGWEYPSDEAMAEARKLAVALLLRRRAHQPSGLNAHGANA